MAASMNTQLCLPCNPKNAGCSRTAPAAHSLTRMLGVGPVRRKNGRGGRVAVRAVLTPNGYTASSQNAGFEEIPTPSIPSLGESLSLFCSLQGCVLSQQYLPGFNLLQGSGWRIGYEASPSSEDDFCATIGGDRWSLALSAKQFHELCHLFKVLANALEDESESFESSLMLTGKSVYLEATVTNRDSLDQWRSRVRQDQEIPACVEVSIGLTIKSSGSKPQGGIWTDFAISEMMVKARQLFWAAEESSSEIGTGRSRLADAAQHMLSSAELENDHALAIARNNGAFPAVDLEPYELSNSRASSVGNGRCERLAAAAAANGTVVVGSAASATRQRPGVSSKGEQSRGEGYEDNESDRRRKVLDTSGPITGYCETMKNFWFPVAFTKDLDEKTMIPFDCFDKSWVLFRGADGEAGCIRDECAHRSCPLSLGSVNEGKITCPYHGWEFETSGKCVKMPSTRTSSVRVKSLPCVEKQGLVWVWPGKGEPDEVFPNTMPPSEYSVHAEIVIDLPVEHGLLVENLLDLAHAPFTHTSTFAKGWSVPNLVRFRTPSAAVPLEGHWDPYPIAMEFRPPCIVVSTIGLVKPGQLEAASQSHDCSQHLFQLHACIPSSTGSTRLLYRMGLDFAHWVKHVPFIEHLWMKLANQVLDEDLRLVLGQQDRMRKGANVWNHPVIYDKLGVNYRRWRNGVEEADVQVNN